MGPGMKQSSQKIKHKWARNFFFLMFSASLERMQLRALCSSRQLEFNAQQPHSGSHPSTLVSSALFWHAGVHTDRAHIK